MKNIISSLHDLRARLGAKWCVVGLLVPPTAFGIYHFGANAALVVTFSVFLCMAVGIVTRLLCRESFELLHPGAIITGLLLGLTLSTNTPLYMIVIGALVAELPGKYKWKWLGRNPFNPAALGRTAVAVLESLDSSIYDARSVDVDVATGASALFKEAGGNVPPALADLFMGLHKGAIGETSELLLIPVGLLMLWFVAVKWHAALAMIVTVPLLIICLPVSPEVVGHAPWMYDPLVYLLGGNTFLLAVFFATDPMTTPQTRLGGAIFGVGIGVLGVLGRFYTTIPGVEMYAVLIMNLTVPVMDRVLQARALRQAKARHTTGHPSAPALLKSNDSHRGGALPPLKPSALNSVRTFFAEETEEPRALDLPSLGNLQRITSPIDREPFSEFKKLIAAGNREAVLDLIQMTDRRGRNGDSYSDVEKLVTAANRKTVLETIEASGLLGCGGARFPVHIKWKTVLDHAGPRVLIANGQEGEPETFKDRFLMQHHARLVVEGLAIAAYVIEAKGIAVVVTARCQDALNAMTAAVAEFEQLAERKAIPSIRVVPGPDLYICGEETALIESLESHRGEPRLRPPLPVESGLHGRPTLVQNVETLSWLPSILHHGPDWFRGTRGNGFQLVSLSGAVAQPGIYEVETGTPLRHIVKMGGGLTENQQLLAIAVGGPSGGLLPPSKLDLPFERVALSEAGTMMGTGAVRVLGSSDSVMNEALVAATFFRDESCGRCTPCRVGTSEVVRLWQKVSDGEAHELDLAQIREVAVVMRQTSTCSLGSAAAGRILSVMEHWPEQVDTCLSASGAERTN